MDEKPINFKVLVLGDMSVGKTCFLIRFCDGKFAEGSLATIGIDFRNKYLMHNNKKIELELWDTAGQERFRCITKNYFKGTDGIILIYDLTKRTTFTNVKNWMKSIKDVLNLKDIGVVICGNKCDCDDSERTVSVEEGKKMADHYGVKFYETSSKTDTNINQSFITLIEDMIAAEQASKGSRKRSSSKIERRRKDDDKKEKKDCGC